MDYTPLEEEGKTLSPTQLPSLYRACQELADGRKARGKRYDLAGVLLVGVLAKLAGMSTVLAVSQWAKDQEKVIRRCVGLGWKRMPCANTYSYVLARLDSQQVNAHREGQVVELTDFLGGWNVEHLAHIRAFSPDSDEGFRVG